MPGISEICLHKARPDSGLARLALQAGAAFGTPYWAFHWAGGLALARHILDHPATVAGRHVLDLGAGSGLVGIAAARAGAADVIAGDIDPYAIAALALNSALNHIAVTAIHGDMIAGDPPAVDIVLVGDLFYDRVLAKRVTAFLDRCRAAGIDVLIGDPHRAFLPHDRLTPLADYLVSEIGNAARPSTVFAFGR